MALRRYIFLASLLTLPTLFAESVANDLAIRSSAITDFFVALEERRVEWSRLPLRESQRRLFDWESQNKIPPWMSHISPGSEKSVGILLGQSLQPDGSPAPVLLSRIEMTKHLLDTGRISKVIVSGGDPSGLGRTEASLMAKLLRAANVPSESIIQESQSTTTAENAWFALRWIPQGTGQFHIITSDFHMPRATYIFNEVFNFFYKMAEDRFRNDTEWKSEPKKYPRLELHQQTAKSFCGADRSQNQDDHREADISQYSLAKRAVDELGFLGSMEVANALYGAPRNIGNQVWPMQIDVSHDLDNIKNFEDAMAQAMNCVQSLCECTSRPDPAATAPLDPYPLAIPIPTTFPGSLNASVWQVVVDACKTATAEPSQKPPHGQNEFHKDGDWYLIFWVLCALSVAGLVVSAAWSYKRFRHKHGFRQARLEHVETNDVAHESESRAVGSVEIPNSTSDS